MECCLPQQAWETSEANTRVMDCPAGVICISYPASQTHTLGQGKKINSLVPGVTMVVTQSVVTGNCQQEHICVQRWVNKCAINEVLLWMELGNVKDCF